MITHKRLATKIKSNAPVFVFFELFAGNWKLAVSSIARHSLAPAAIYLSTSLLIKKSKKEGLKN